MTVKECYELLNGNYDDAKSRLMSDRLIEKFMLKFPQDETMQQLDSALKEENYEEAFRFAHTLKGVAANLAFSALQASSSELTEFLRNDKSKPNETLVQNVHNDYDCVIESLAKYQNEQQ